MYSILGHYSLSASTAWQPAKTQRVAACNPMCCRPGHRLGALLHGSIQEERATFQGHCLRLLTLLTTAYYACYCSLYSLLTILTMSVLPTKVHEGLVPYYC